MKASLTRTLIIYLCSWQLLLTRTTCSLATWTRDCQRRPICRNSSILTPMLQPCWSSKRTLTSRLTLYRYVLMAGNWRAEENSHCYLCTEVAASISHPGFLLFLVFSRPKEWKSKLLMSSCQTTNSSLCHGWSTRSFLMSSVLSNSFTDAGSKITQTCQVFDSSFAFVSLPQCRPSPQILRPAHHRRRGNFFFWETGVSVIRLHQRQGGREICLRVPTAAATSLWRPHAEQGQCTVTNPGTHMLNATATSCLAILFKKKYHLRVQISWN